MKFAFDEVVQLLRDRETELAKKSDEEKRNARKSG
jgi:hypothetical protein